MNGDAKFSPGQGLRPLSKKCARNSCERWQDRLPHYHNPCCEPRLSGFENAGGEGGSISQSYNCSQIIRTPQRRANRTHAGYGTPFGPIGHFNPGRSQRGKSSAPGSTRLLFCTGAQGNSRLSENGIVCSRRLLQSSTVTCAFSPSPIPPVSTDTSPLTPSSLPSDSPRVLV
jgi:hypothetical protein